MINIHVPELSESVSEATLLNWQKQVGDTVVEGDVLVELETDKITMEIYASCNGVIANLHVQSGADVKSGDPLVDIDDSVDVTPTTAAVETAQADTGVASQLKEAPPPPATTTEALAASVKSTAIAMPSARKMADEQGISLTDVTGTGKGGRITKGDVLNMTALSKKRTDHRVPMSRLRTRVAERLLQSQHDTATLTTFNEVNMQAIIDIRATYRDGFEKKYGIKLGLTSFFVQAVVAALKQYPVINATVEDTHIVYHEYYDIGVAVSSSRGLVVPVIRDADRYSLAEIEKIVADYSARAKTGALEIEEISGGTFSITNGGVFGSMLSTPIINPPQSAILGIHATKQRPVVENGAIVARPVCYLALSYDHRIIDGHDAVLFLVAVKNALEDPTRLLLEI